VNDFMPPSERSALLIAAGAAGLSGHDHRGLGKVA
jgi:hypothetical protein